MQENSSVVPVIDKALDALDAFTRFAQDIAAYVEKVATPEQQKHLQPILDRLYADIRAAHG